MKFFAASPLAWVFAKAFAPSSDPAPFASRTTRAVSGAVAPARVDAAPCSPEVKASQPFSCMSSGRAKARDVEAARRYFVEFDKKRD